MHDGQMRMQTSRLRGKKTRNRSFLYVKSCHACQFLNININAIYVKFYNILMHENGQEGPQKCGQRHNCNYVL
jgi:hypothetical protein